jgi:hypothetical protein
VYHFVARGIIVPVESQLEGWGEKAGLSALAILGKGGQWGRSSLFARGRINVHIEPDSPTVLAIGHKQMEDNL